MKTLILATSLIISSAYAKTFEVNFTYEGLKIKNASASYELESSAFFCQKLAVGTGGVSIYQKFKENEAQVEDLGNSQGKVSFEYQEGGICNYKLRSISINFIKDGVEYIHQTRLDVVTEAEYGGGNLEKIEVLKNSSKNVDVTCKKNTGKYKYTSCFRHVEGASTIGRGQPAVLYMFEEYLSENNMIDGLNFIQEVE